MTKEEMINKVTSRPKWYLGLMKQQTASAMIKRFKNGSLSEKNFNSLVKMIGYQQVSPAQFEEKIFGFDNE